MTNVMRLAGIFLSILPALSAQSVNPAVTVPRTVRYSGSFHPADGFPVQSMEGVTVAVYADQTGGDSLWQETQNVQVDASGNFAVEMGATQSDGLPLDLLRTGESRWVGVRVNRPGESEQPRVRLLSVPYALRASDSETLGGLPASAYLLNPSVSVLGKSGEARVAASAPASTNAVKPHVTSGNANYLGLFTNSTDLGNSVLYQNGARIGLNTVLPGDYLHVAFNDSSGSVTGYAVQNLGGGAASYSGMLFYDQHGALAQFQGFNNTTHEYRINNIASNPSINFMLGSQSKFLVRSDGDIDTSGSMRKGGTLFLHNLGGLSTAVGLNALAAISTGCCNTGIGYQALSNNTSGVSNTAVGTQALGNNTSSNYNTASGASALQNNTTGSGNTASGYNALFNNTTGIGNTAIGTDALFSNTIGGANTAVGEGALVNTTGIGNTAIGHFAGQFSGGSHNIIIGNIGNGGDDHVIRIGDVQSGTFIAGIRGATTGLNDAVSVVIDSNGQLGTVSSSRRFKEDIQDMGDASTNLLNLRPVTYRYKQPYADGSKPLDYGLIAEEVAEVYPDLAVKNKDGQIETVQYQKLTPMLLNELQKQNETIRHQQERIGSLEGRLAALEAQLSGSATSATGR